MPLRTTPAQCSPSIANRAMPFGRQTPPATGNSRRPKPAAQALLLHLSPGGLPVANNIAAVPTYKHCHAATPQSAHASEANGSAPHRPRRNTACTHRACTSGLCARPEPDRSQTPKTRALRPTGPPRGVSWGYQTLKQTCSRPTGSAACVREFDDSLYSAIRTTYRISLRSSSLQEPRHPLLKVAS